MRPFINFKNIEYQLSMYGVNNKVLWLFIGRFVQAIIAMCTIRVMTEFLNSSEVGNQYLINSVILWFSLVLINPVGMFINRHLHEWKSNDELYLYINQINKYFLAIAVLSIPIVFIVKTNIDIALSIPRLELILFVAMYVYFSTWFQTLVSFFNFFNFQKIFVILNIFSQTLGLSISFFVVKYINSNALGWMSGLLLGQVIALVMAVFLFRGKFNNVNLQYKGKSLFSKDTFVFCYPVALATLFMWFVNNGYRLIIEKKMGIEAVAALGVGLGLATSLAAVIESIATQYFYPTYYEKLLNSDLKQRSQAWDMLFKKMMSVYIPTLFLFMSLTYLVVKVLTSQNFHHISSYVFIGIIIEFFRQSSNVAYLVAHGEKKTKLTVFPYFLGTVVLMFSITVFLLFFSLDINAVLISLLAASLSTYVFNLIMVHKLINNRIEIKPLIKISVCSLPLLIPVFIFSTESSLVTLISACVLSIIWYLVVLYTQRIK